MSHNLPSVRESCFKGGEDMGRIISAGLVSAGDSVGDSVRDSVGDSVGDSHGGIRPSSMILWKSEMRISKGVCCCHYFFCCLKSHQLSADAV